MKQKQGLKKLIAFTGLALLIIVGIRSVIIAKAAANQTKDSEVTSKSKLKLDKSTIILGEGYTVELKALNATSKVKFKSSNETVAMVNEKGIITGGVVGRAVITAEDDGTNITCTVYVKQVEKDYISLWDSFTDLEKNASFKYKYSPYVTSGVTFVNARQLLLAYKELGYKADGIYAVVHSDNYIRIDGIDKKGNIVGSYTKKGDFVVNIEGATDFIVSNAKEGCLIELYPTTPTIIEKEGTYHFDDFTWTKMKDGSLQADYVVTEKGSFVNVGGAGIKFFTASYNIISKEVVDAFTGASQKAFLTGGIRVDGSMMEGNSYPFKLTVIATKEYYNSSNLRVYGVRGLSIKQTYYKNVLDIMKDVKSIGKEMYYPDSLILRDKITLGCIDTQIWTGEGAIFTSKENLKLEDKSQYFLTASNISTFYFVSQMTYAQLIDKWLYGMSATIAEDVMREKGLLKKGESIYTDSDLFLVDSHSYRNIKNYFVTDSNITLENEVVGYFFIRFLQKNYGVDIVKRINQCIITEIEEPSSYWHSVESDKKWIACVKKNTEENVFERFKEEVLNKE